MSSLLNLLNALCVIILVKHEDMFISFKIDSYFLMFAIYRYSSTMMKGLYPILL